MPTNTLTRGINGRWFSDGRCSCVKLSFGTMLPRTLEADSRHPLTYKTVHVAGASSTSRSYEPNAHPNLVHRVNQIQGDGVGI